MEIGPIWRAMMRNKTGAILIALQIAVTMAIMVNAISIMQERGRLMSRPSGIDEQQHISASPVSVLLKISMSASPSRKTLSHCELCPEL